VKISGLFSLGYGVSVVVTEVDKGVICWRKKTRELWAILESDGSFFLASPRRSCGATRLRDKLVLIVRQEVETIGKQNTDFFEKRKRFRFQL
jgi:hypothetical protein